MQRFKNFVAVMLGVAVLLVVTSLVTQQSAKADDKKGLRAFYLTTTTHTGGQALAACAAGFHMASLWEILDPSNLRYDTTLGFTLEDSGAGPPSAPSVGLDDASGWVRTGFRAAGIGGGIIGTMNCAAYGSSAHTDFGSLVQLQVDWDEAFLVDPVTPIGPWKPRASTCDVAHKVWCVED